jgi:hypothetical protein
LKRDKLLGLYVDGSEESTRASPPATSTARIDPPNNVGNWPAPAPRATGLPRAIAPAPAQHPLFSPSELLKPVDTLSVASKRALASSFEMASCSKFSNGSKGTMETLPAQTFFQRPSTPPMSIDSQASESPVTMPSPAWTRKFAHLFSDSPSKESGLSAAPPSRDPVPPTQTAPIASASKPPDLRKQQAPSIATTPVAPREPYVNNLDVNVAPLDKEQPTAPQEVLRSSSASHLRNVSDTSNPDPTSLVEVRSLDPMATYAKANTTQKIAVQKRLLDSFIPKKPTPSTNDHDRYLKGKLISALEEEMDMPQRTTRQELYDMNDAELDTHFNKIKAMHKLSWETKQRRYEIGEMDVRASLAAFQEDERERVMRNDGSPGHH